jgi:hypothetical protein
MPVVERMRIAWMPSSQSGATATTAWSELSALASRLLTLNPGVSNRISFTLARPLPVNVSVASLPRSTP